MSESIPPVQPVTVTPVAAANSTRSWEVLCHLSSLLGLFFGFVWIPCLNILGPLIVWLVKKGDSTGVDAHGKESINFHLSWTLYAIVSFILLFASIIGIILIPFWLMAVYAEIVVMIILTIVAAVKASNGVLYRYPLTIRFLK